MKVFIMATLSNKIKDFKQFFNIKELTNQNFKLDEKGGLVVKWNDEWRLLTSSRNSNTFLSKTTLQYKRQYGIEFLRALKIVPSKSASKKLKKQKEQNSLEEHIKTFKKTFNITTDIPELKIVDGRLSGFWNGAWLPLSQKNNNKLLANSTLQKKYGESFLRAYNIPTIKRKPKKKENIKTNFLAELPFNQFKYDKDFKEATETFFNSKASNTRPTELVLKQLPNAVGLYLKSYEMIIPSKYKDPMAFFNEVKPMLLNKIKHELKLLTGLKYSIALEVLLHKDNADGTRTYTDPPFRSYTKQNTVLNEDEINVDEQTSYILENIENFIQNGSGWKVDSLMTLWLDFAKYEPIKGGSYIPLPTALKNKRAVINIKNEDDNCLRYTLRSALFPAIHNIERISSYPKQDGLDFEGIDAPTPISQISKVEKLNRLAINVYGWKNNKVIIHKISNQPPETQRINTLLIEDSETGGTHYVWVKHFNRLLASQHKNTLHKYYCERCLIGYSRTDLLEQHIVECKGINQRAIRIEMPTESQKFLKFENHKKQLKAPWVIYADFEANTTKIEGPTLNKNASFTQKTQLHEACGFALRAVRSDGMTIGPVVYRGLDAVKNFLKEVQKLEVLIKEMLKNRIKQVNLTDEEHKQYMEATTCWICEEAGFDNGNKKICIMQKAMCLNCALTLNKNLTKGEYIKDFEAYKKEHSCSSCKSKFNNKDKVRDHDHITGKYRGAAHANCNSKLRINPDNIEIPIFFHNLRGYDSHLIMQQIGEMEGSITCIPNNKEKYISFSLGQLVFKDSMQFLLASLDKLVKSNKKESFKNTRIGRTKEEFELLLRKGVYPYEYMDSWERFNETQLPPIDAFYSKLSGCGINEEDYEHAQKVWKIFDCKNMGDYHDLYLRTDVDLLTDVFEEFRNLCINTYKLDPANYYTSPGLSWDALLKKTNVNLELLTDYDMHLMIEKGLRGGISMVSKRYAKANNPLIESYDPNKKNSYIMYLDANNLYGWSMVQHLPTGRFKWSDASISDILKHKADDEKGYICEVDMTYPEHLHDDHNDYPLATEKLEVQKEWLSNYQNEIIGSTSLKVKKLVPNLRNKEKYVVHYRNLQLYTSLGIKITKLHRVLEFDQSPWMASYIEMNTELRKKARSDFEKDFFKLMNNSVFGKTLECVRKRINIQLIKGNKDLEKLRKLIAKPSYAGRKTFSDNLTAVHMYKDKLKLNRPIYVGMSILDLSKHLMYDYYYNHLKLQYKNNCSLLYIDTDSFLLYIETDDVYKDIENNAEQYDTSNYDKNHFLFDETNMKVLGKFKDELSGTPIQEYVGLRPKMYSIISPAGELRKAKGVKKSVVKNEITHENYKQSLFENKMFRHSMNMLRSYDHQIYGIHLNKISLSPLDTKRWIADDRINTLAYGHYKTLKVPSLK